MENFINYAQEAMNWSENSSWITQIFIVIFATLVVSFVLNIILGRLEKKLQKTANAWDDAVIVAFRKPIKFIIWVLGITYATEIIYLSTEAPIFSGVDAIRDVFVIITFAWAVNRFIRNVQKNIHQKAVLKGDTIDETTSDAIANILKLAVGITTFLVVLQTLGFSIEGVLAFGGVGGIAIGFAAKDLLANFFGALMIYFDRPFAIGDWIRSPDREIEGTVERIGWRLTVIRTFDKRPLYVPNSMFANIAVENPSRMKNRRIKENVGVRYDDMSNVEKIVGDIKAMLQKHEEIDQKQTLIVNLLQFGPSSVDIMIYTFTKTTNWIRFHEVKQDVLMKIADVIEANGAEMAFPTQTLHIENSENEFEAAAKKPTKKISKKGSK